MAGKQTLEEAYGEPANFLEIDVCNPQTHGFGRSRYTDYEVHTRVSYGSTVPVSTIRSYRTQTNLPVFKLKDSKVRRRYSEFAWLREELERESKVVVPPLPNKALGRQLPFLSEKDGQ